MPYLVYERILKDPIDFDEDFTDEEAKAIIRKLLNKCSEGRIVTSIKEFKAHSWFKNINWIDLLQERLDAPYCPKMEDDLNSDLMLKNDNLDQVIDFEMSKHFGQKRRLRAGITFEIEKLWEDDSASFGKRSSSTVDVAH